MDRQPPDTFRARIVPLNDIKVRRPPAWETYRKALLRIAAKDKPTADDCRLLRNIASVASASGPRA